ATGPAVVQRGFAQRASTSRSPDLIPATVTTRSSSTDKGRLDSAALFGIGEKENRGSSANARLALAINRNAATRLRIIRSVPRASELYRTLSSALLRLPR